MPNKSILFAALVFACGLEAGADYISSRKAAAALAQSGKHQEALAAFSNLVAEAKSDFQKTDALEQAAFWAGILKQHDLALEFAQRIPIPAAAKNCRMKILRDTGKSKELIAEFKDERIADWPESLVGEGSFHRGAAYYSLKDGKAAEADLKTAANYLTDDTKAAAALLMLADNYRNNLQDDARALEAYAKVTEKLKGSSYITLTAVISAAAIRRKQGKCEEALKTLQQADISKMGGTWLGTFLCAYGEIHEAQGKKAEALAKYKEAAAISGLPASQKDSYEKKVKALQTEAK